MASDPDWIRIQRKTFTRWCNTHLVQVSLVIDNLEEDLATGYVLHQLVTILSQRTLAKAQKNPSSNFQKLQNLNVALDALTRQEQVKLVNISAEDIMNKNSKLDLGLIWTLILKYQISRSEYGDDANTGPKKALLEWANRVLNPQGVYVKDFTGSWQDGAGFCGLVNAIEPGTIDLSQLNKDDADEKLKNMNKAFDEGEGKFGIAHLLDAEDVQKTPDELSIMSYVSLYRAYMAQSTADASKCTAEGPGLTHGKTREKAPFTVTTRNEEGERITRGGANVVAKLVGPDGKETKAIVKDQLNGTYAGHYEVRVPGTYELTILVGGKPIQNSPFHPEIKPSGPSAQFSIAYGPGVEQAVSGQETHFTIKSVDEGEKELTEGGHTFPAKFIDAASGEEIPITVTDNNDGKYSAKYTPKTAGQASVIVLLKTEEGDVPIKGSPYAVLVVPGSLDLSNVVLSGEGLKRVVAGEKGEFFVQAKDSNLNNLVNGDNQLKADLDGPEDIKVDVVNNGDGTYAGSFVPTKIGDYKLDVVFDGDKKVPGAPFAVEVVPAAPNADHTVASGDGLKKTEAGEPNGFKVEVRDQFDNPVGKGGDNVTAEITPNEDGAAPITVAVKDNGDGTYSADYAPINKAGPYTVHVKLNGQPIKDAPFSLDVVPSSKGSDPEKSFVVGIGEAVAGETQNPVIHSVDPFGNLIAGGGDDVKLTISGPEDVEVTVKDNGDGTYTADYVPTKAGEYQAAVNINGKPVKNTPITFNVVPSVVDAGHCVASGNGVAKANSGKSANFKVQLRDRFDNDITSNPGVTCASVLTLKEVRKAHEYPDSSDDEGKEKPQAEAPQSDVPVQITDNGDGTFGASYVLRNAGTFELQVTVNGGNVRDAPFTIRGNPGKPHIPNSVVRGARKGKAGVDGARVVLRDANGNPRHKGGQQVKARLVPKPQDREIDAIDNGDGSYTIPYPADANGSFDMALSCGDDSIPGDYAVAVAETPLSPQQEQAIQQALPGSGATVANLLKKAPLEEREKFAAELAALKSGAPAPVAQAAPVAVQAAAPVDDGRAAAAEQQAQQAQEQAAAAEHRAQEAEQRAQEAAQHIAESENKAQAAEQKAAALEDEVQQLKRQLADAQSAPAPAAAPHHEESSSEEQQQQEEPQHHEEQAAPASPHKEESSSEEAAAQQASPRDEQASPRDDAAPESPKSKKEQKKEAKLAKKNSKKENKQAEAAAPSEPVPVAPAAAAASSTFPAASGKKPKKEKSKKKKK